MINVTAITPRALTADYDDRMDASWRLECATARHLNEMLDCPNSVEEAIRDRADLVRVAIDELAAQPSRGAEIAERLQRMIRSYFEPLARSRAERAL